MFLIAAQSFRKSEAKIFTAIKPFVFASLLVVTLLALSACAGAPTPTVALPASTAVSIATPVPAPTTAPISVPVLAMTPAQETVVRISQNVKLGSILTDAQNMTLYTYKKDTADASNCTGACAKLWLPLTIPQGVTPIAAPGIAGNIGEFERADGAYQILYNDAPLYRYAGDKTSGDTNGNGLDNLWSVVTLPPAGSASATPAAGAVDWTRHGFPTIRATQDITPTDAVTITVGTYSIFVPPGAFSAPVKFVVLSGNPSTFQAKAPHGETPILAFALNVRDAQTNELISQFNQPLQLIVTDNRITENSGYYNVGTNGDYRINLAGMQVQNGELAHPLAGTNVGWVITAPAAPSTTLSTTSIPQP